MSKKRLTANHGLITFVRREHVLLFSGIVLGGDWTARKREELWHVCLIDSVGRSETSLTIIVVNQDVTTTLFR